LLQFVFILLFSVSCNSTQQSIQLSDNYTLYIGTFGDTIYKYSVSKDSLVFTELNKVNVKNPSYLALSDDKKFIYSVSENGENSAVAAIKNDSTFSLINLETSVAAGPCFIKFYNNSVFTANYSSGSMNLFPVENKTGKILPTTFFANYNELKPNLKEQIAAHAHTTRVLEVKDSNKVNAFLLVTDLGADKIMSYKIESDSTGVKLKENTPLIFLYLKNMDQGI
jgi:3-carboxymuconate cyclase